MKNWDSISTELDRPLDKAHVKPPPKGKYGEYIEGWHAIAEANRIFGFDGWSYSVDTLAKTNEMLADKKDRNGAEFQQWEVGYTAMVTVTVGGVSRQDVGHGQGHSRQAGDAHDSAVKEAVTDGLKRSLRTFGNPFGLALYDKTKANVQDTAEIQRKADLISHWNSALEAAADIRALGTVWNDIPQSIKPECLNTKDTMKAKLQEEAA